ncbi:MAG: histidine--tRNA ligase [Ignavibacteria bacterium]
MTIIKKPRGTQDFLPEDCDKRLHIENKLREVAALFNYREIRTPTFEKTELFKRGIGEETDVVSKEMYSFNNDEYTLKPEMTAPVIRAYLENHLYNKSPLQKLYYIANMYRHERPQAGRFREFSQFGAEAIGSDNYSVDVELIALSHKILSIFCVKDIVIKINTIGDFEERKEYLKHLTKYLRRYESDLSLDSQKRLQRNPLRILDSKDEKDISILKEAPVLFEFLSSKTRTHFERVLDGLKTVGIRYEVDYRLVRGFDYYTSTTFEVISPLLGSQNAIFGGGRYNRLVEQLGGPPTPAIGFACGLERLTYVIEKSNYNFPSEKGVDIFIAYLGETAFKLALKISSELRDKGMKIEIDHLYRSLKSQLKEANRLGVKYCLIIGENEIKESSAILRDMLNATEKRLPLETLSTELYNLVSKND